MNIQKPIHPERRAFTLAELLVVLAIIGLLAVVALPSMKGLQKSNVMINATRQLIDDLAQARQSAIRNRSKVLVVFAPPVNPDPTPFNSLSASYKNVLLRGQQVSYALYSRRGVGDQPGQSIPRYLTAWKDLPEGVFIPAWKFTTPQTLVGQVASPLTVTIFNYTNDVPVPRMDGVSGPAISVPFVAFDEQGRLLAGNLRDLADTDAIIPLARGSVFLSRDVNNGLVWEPADIRENPPNNSIDNYNLVVVDKLTGRARTVRPEIQ